MNKVILIGNIATEIDMQYTPNGNGVIKFNLAVNNRDEATFIPVEAWKTVAENTAKFCGKGSKIAVDGSIKIDQWEKDGQKRSFTKVLAHSIQFLDSKKSSNQSNSQDNDPFKDNGEPIDINDDMLPF